MQLLLVVKNYNQEKNELENMFESSIYILKYQSYKSLVTIKTLHKLQSLFQLKLNPLWIIKWDGNY